MANCEMCRTEKPKKTREAVPYIVHESEMARCERQIKRLWVALIVTVALSLVGQIAWIGYISTTQQTKETAAFNQAAIYEDLKSL